MLDRRTARPSPNREKAVRPAPLQVQVPLLTAVVPDLAEEDRPAVPELRHPRPELVPRIPHGYRVAAGERAVAGEVFNELLAGRLRRIEVEESGRVRVEADEVRGRHRGRADPLVEGVREPGVGVVET